MRSCRIISGGKNSGKTTYMLKLLSSSPGAHGFYSQKTSFGYTIVDIETKDEYPLMSREPMFGQRFLSWSMDESVFGLVYQRMEHILLGSVFLDEVGRLELEGRGYASTIKMLVTRDIDLTITVRSDFVQDVIDYFGLDGVTVVEAVLK